MCLEGSQDFEDDIDCDLSPDLLRMVEQEEKQILPHKKIVEIVTLEEGKVDCKPVQQKLQRMMPDIMLKIKEEVKKQFDVGFLQEIKYSEWVANIVSVPKKDGKVQMCIKMHPQDRGKTTFITLWGMFCYKVMSFGLKNAGTTYQRAMVTLFHDMMHKEIEVYVDDMIAKSRTEEEHIQVLRKLFLRIRKFQLKLNPAKCNFGARSGKLLGFVVSERGIEIDSDKKCDPLFRLLKKHNPDVWDDECQRAFDKLDPLKYMVESTTLNGRMARWQILLSEFDIVYVSQKAVKGSLIADFLASRALEDYEPLNFDFPNEDLMYVGAVKEDTLKDHLWKINFNGASNAIGNRIGAVLVSPNGDHYPFTCKLDFDCTNNMAGYEACIMGLRATVERKIKVLEMADALATLAAMIKVGKQEDVKPIQMSIYEAPAHCYNVDEEERDDHPWYHGEILYKRRKDQILLRCVDAIEAKKILEEVHEGVCGTYANGFTMARQIMRFGYYWSTMEGDSSNGHRFIFVVIDYFTKWVEATSYANVTKSTVSRFLKKEIICRYGMPEKIISDNALNLNNSSISEVCSQFKIRHHNSSSYRPKMNGAVEAANKNIKKIVGKMTDTYRDWHEKLPFALYAYRTSVRTSTKATPFSLVYGMEAVLPIEVEIPSLRVLSELKLDEAEWIQSRYDQLNLI
ncbi:reverse transcriptase [Gossypium australe]|uniref:Reverse transcriptase n=1 Tax=Gossypium australe TaxID=47621 RepID=A0A5B6W8A9_9ROSI|nr:reverse transcriptase [Gossypium australe]